MLFNAALRKVPRVTTLAETLTIALVLLSVFSLVVASSFQIVLNVRSQQAVVAAQLQITSLQTAEKVVALITETVNILKAASVVGRPFEVSRVKRELFLQSLLKLHSSFQDVMLLDSEGQELQKLSRWKAASPDEFMNQVHSDLFQQIRQQQNYVGAFHLDPDTHEPLIAIAVPILDTFGKFEGGLAADVNIRTLWEVVANLKIGQVGQVYVVDRDGKLLAYKNTARVLARENVNQLAHVAEFVRHPDKKNTGSVRRAIGIDGMAVVATVVPLENPDWAVIVELPVWEAYRTVLWSVVFSASAGFIVAIISSVVAVYLARRLAQPLRHLTETAGRIAGGELDQPIDIKGQGEIGLLARSFAEMRDAIQARIAALHDEIAERKRVEEALRESEAFLHNIVENIPDMIFVKDARELRFVRFNKAGESLLGYSRQELLGKGDYDFFPTHEADFFTRHDRDVLEQHTLHDIPEETIQTRNHGQRILHTKKIPILDQEGEPLYLLGISEDITMRKQVEDALRESENRFATFMEYLPANVTIKDHESRFLYANKQMSILFDTAQWGGKTAREYFPPEIAERVLLTDRQALEHGPMIFEEAVSIKTGEIRVFETRKFPIKQQGRPDLIGIISLDITERKRAEEGIRSLNAELEQRVRDRTAKLEAANKELQSFVYVVSHDLKAPLRAINRLVNWLVDDYDGIFDAKGNEMVDLLISRVKRMDNLIEGILEYSRVGRIAGQVKAIDLNQVLSDIVDSLSPPPGIQIIIASALPVIPGDIIRIQQVFSNLIGNAVKFMDNPMGTITIRCEDAGADWQFSVADNGPGIAPKYHDKIFQIFQTLRPRDEFESIGIGLSIVKKIVELYGGKIWVESEAGNGSTFLFTFPKQGIRL